MEKRKSMRPIVKGMDSLKDEIFGPILLLIYHLEQMFLHNIATLPSDISTQQQSLNNANTELSETVFTPLKYD